MNIEISESAGVRSLHFGTPWVQGSMRIARPWSLELEYTQDMMLPLLLHGTDWPEQVLMIGLGSGSMAKFLYRHRPACRITAVEISAAVIQAAFQHFRLPRDSARLQIVEADGFAWMEQDRQRYDLILLDGFDLNARAHRLESATFYALCRARLAPEGMLSCNLLTLHRSHAATRRALDSVFGAGMRLLPPCAEGNVVALAGLQDWAADNLVALRETANTMRKATQLNLLPLLSRIERASGSGHGAA